MAARVAINGIGRMGRLALRAAWGFAATEPESLHRPSGPWGEGGLELAHVNEPAGNAETAAHLLTFDSVHGRWPVPVRAEGGGLAIGNRYLGFSQVPSPAALDWRELGIDLVLECPGRFKSAEALAPLACASAPGPVAIP